MLNLAQRPLYYLDFNHQKQFGSAEHFYHFLWGYLLPAMSQVVNIGSNGQPASHARFLFRTCGPVMDNLIHETAGLFDLDYQLVDKEYGDAAATKIPVPRWDVELRELDSRRPMKLDRRLGQCLVRRWQHRRTAARLAGDIHRVRASFKAKVAGVHTGDAVRTFAGKFLVLKRSAQPAYYEPGGKAEVPGYGTARRSLVGLEESVRTLQEQDLPVVLFEPGSVSLTEQIQAFSNCRGIAGIYGAEFANVVWMPPDTPVIWIYDTNTNHIPWITKQLSQLLRLRFVPVKAADKAAPALPLDILGKWLVSP